MLQICIGSICLVSATPPTVLGQSFWNFTGTLQLSFDFTWEICHLLDITAVAGHLAWLAVLLDLHLSISNGFVSSKIYDKCDDFDFDIVNFPFLDGEVPHSTSYDVYISQLIRFARVSSHVADFNARNKSLTAKLLQQGYRYHKRLSPNFIADTMNWFLNSMFD